MSDFQEHFNFSGGVCIIAFAAADQRVFQFGRLLRTLQLPHVLMRDSASRWYQRGVNGLGDRETVVAYLRDLKQRFGYVKTVGISSGSYAALLYGQLADVDEIIAISPSTVGSDVAIDIDPQWHHLVSMDADIPIDDLRRFFADGTRAHVRAFVSDGEGTILDAYMARRLGIEPTLIPGHPHAFLARYMRDCGMLTSLLKERVGGET